MNYHVTIDRPSADGLSSASWHFWVRDDYHGRIGISIMLQRYVVLNRATKRHKFQRVGEWESGGSVRRAYVRQVPYLDVLPPVPPSVLVEVRQRVVESIEVILPEPVPVAAKEPV